MAGTLPARRSVTAYAYTDLDATYRWLPSGTAQDFTGWSAVLRIGAPPGATLLEVESTEPGGRLILGTDGTITVHLSPTEVAALAVGVLFYTLDLIEPDGTVLRFMRGPFTVLPDVAPQVEASP